MLCYVMLCYAMSCHVMSCHVMSCHVILCHAMLCYVMLCHVVLYQAAGPAARRGGASASCSWARPRRRGAQTNTVKNNINDK